MLEFENNLVMVSNVSMARLVLLFTIRIGRTFERAREIPQDIHVEGCHEFNKRCAKCVAKNQISLPSLRKVRNHGKRTHFPKKIKEDQAKNNLEERSYVSHANNLGFRDIDVPRERCTTLKFSLKMMKRGRRRRKQNLQPKKRGMKQKNKSSTLPRQEKLQYS